MPRRARLPRRGQGLAAQLPQGVAEYLRHEGESRGEPFSAEEFFRRAGSRTDVSIEAVRDSSRAVTEMMKQMLSAGELEDLRQRLSRDLAGRFESESPVPSFCAPLPRLPLT
ncbi:DUF2267 domain-containing protein [Rubrobacter aplysinae]|uniref:DUF2267 domain-containing protein n=1 Tax=Rubrobacter aplysinae TaxID=909625 RepID=UPI00064BE4B7|nr:DUF2267 domain-containing protein [Rubrobacter aplysinae]